MKKYIVCLIGLLALLAAYTMPAYAAGPAGYHGSAGYIAPVDITGPGITTATTGMGIRITLALPSAQDGADGDRDGGARLLTPIILPIPIMPRLLSFSNNSRSSMSQQDQGQSDYWYYCQNPQGYYPYVNSCPGGWMKVVPQPPPGR